MRIYAVDDEYLMLEMLCGAIKEAIPGAEPERFSLPSKLLEAAKEKAPDLVFLDVRMPGMDGIELAKRLKEILPQVNIIFVTGYSEYSVEAFRLFATGYIMKPVDADQIRDVMKNLRFPIPTGNRASVRTFGNFAVFVKNKPVRFRLAKSEELLAYLVDRQGAVMTKAEVAAAAFEEDTYSRTVQAELTRAARWLEEDLAAAGIEGMFHRDNGDYFVDCSAFDCDLYDYLAGKEGVSYHGEYMEQFSWGEYRKANIERELYR